MTNKILVIILSATLGSTAVVMGAITSTSDDFSDQAGTYPNWVEVSGSGIIAYHSDAAAHDYDWKDNINSQGNPLDGDGIITNLLGDTEATGDGVQGDGGLVLARQTIAKDNETIGLTLSGTMENLAFITLTVHTYDESNKPNKYNIVLYNLTDGTQLNSKLVSQVRYKAGSYKPLSTTLTYACTAADAGDELQIRIAEADMDQAAGGAWIDSFSLVYDAPDLTAPAAPANVSAAAITNGVALDWDDNTEPDFASYTVYRSETSATGFVSIASGLTESIYTNLPVLADTDYYYVITASDTVNNESANSTEVMVTTLSDTSTPASPTGLAASQGPSRILLDWDNNPEVDFASYNIFRSTTSGGGYTFLTNRPNSVYTDSDVVLGTSYYYVVSALDVNGNESLQSAEAGALAKDDIPAIPAGLKALSRNARVVLDWNDNFEPENDLNVYGVYRSDISGSGYSLLASATNSTYEDTAVTNGLTYYYVVTAIDNIGQESSDSSEAAGMPVNLTFIDDFLPNDYSFTTNPAALPTSADDEWRYDGTQQRVLINTTTDNVGDKSGQFNVRSTLNTRPEIITNADYSAATARLTAIYPAWDNDAIGYGLVSRLLNNPHIVEGWYTITLETAGSTHTATSGVANIFDGPEYTANGEEATGLENNILEAWNQNLNWDVNPLTGDGVLLDSITNLMVTFYYESLTSNTVGKVIYYLYDAPIKYTVTMPSLTSYFAWAGSWGVNIGSETNDYDIDGLDNLLEYAFGGDPTSDDADSIGPAGYVVDDGGSDYLYHVYNRRTDDPSLTYRLGTKTALIGSPAADTNDVFSVGESAEIGSFKSVTNRTGMTELEKFIVLEVEKQ